jgi:DNA-binding transcriptional MerR regulator
MPGQRSREAAGWVAEQVKPARRGAILLLREVGFSLNEIRQIMRPASAAPPHGATSPPASSRTSMTTLSRPRRLGVLSSTRSLTTVMMYAIAPDSGTPSQTGLRGRRCGRASSLGGGDSTTPTAPPRQVGHDNTDAIGSRSQMARARARRILPSPLVQCRDRVRRTTLQRTLR